MLINCLKNTCALFALFLICVNIEEKPGKKIQHYIPSNAGLFSGALLLGLKIFCIYLLCFLPKKYIE